MRLILWTIAICSILIGLVKFAKAEETGFVSGSVSGTYYAVVSDIAKVCTDNVLIPTPSNGSLSNISTVLGNNKVKFGISQYDALLLRSIQDQAKMKNIMMVMPLFGEEIHLLARPGISGIEDLAGKRVVVGKENSGTWVTTQIIKIKTGIKFGEDIYLDPKDGIKALLAGRVDAVFYVAGKPIQALTDIGKDGEGRIKLVSVKHPKIDTFYTPSDVPEGTYPWQSEAVRTLAVKSVLITYNYQSAQSQELVRNLTSCIIANLGKLQEEGHAKWREVDPTSYRDVKWPMHPAAQRVIDGR